MQSNPTGQDSVDFPVQLSAVAVAAAQDSTSAPESLSTAGACPVGTQLAVGRQPALSGVAAQSDLGPEQPGTDLVFLPTFQGV